MQGNQKILPLSPAEKLDSQERITLDLTVPYSELKLTAVLGEGAYGMVYRGQWKNSEVTIKKLKLQKFSPLALEPHPSPHFKSLQ